MLHSLKRKYLTSETPLSCLLKALIASTENPCWFRGKARNRKGILSEILSFWATAKNREDTFHVHYRISDPSLRLRLHSGWQVDSSAPISIFLLACVQVTINIRSEWHFVFTYLRGGQGLNIVNLYKSPIISMMLLKSQWTIPSKNRWLSSMLICNVKKR